MGELSRDHAQSYDIYARHTMPRESRRRRIAVNTHTAGEQNHATVAMDATGDFVVGWMSLGQFGITYMPTRGFITPPERRPMNS